MARALRSLIYVAAAVGAASIGALPSLASTSLQITNPSNTAVYTIITVNTGGPTPSINNIQVNGSSAWAAPASSSPPPPTDNGLYYTCPPTTGGCAGTPVQGFFYLQQGATATITSTVAGNVLSGVSVSFLQPPYACPGQSNGLFPFTPEFTAANGTNFAEVTLNVNTGEFVDVSCNNGANATINVSSAGGPGWYNGGSTTSQPTFSITNSWVNGSTGADNNCSIAGVFPYQFTQCTTGPNACPSSVANTTCTSGTANNGPCEFSRLAGAGGGGTVTVSFMGALQPPVSSSATPAPPGTPPGTPPVTPPPGGTIPAPGQPAQPPQPRSGEKIHPLDTGIRSGGVYSVPD
jgi:hypothetical protein